MVTVGYASGSRAHEADFRVIEESIVELLSGNDMVELCIAGYLELPSSLIKFNDRIRRVAYSGYEAYFQTLAGCDINIVPLVEDRFNDCKSAIRFMEAALVHVPTIVSRVGDFTNLIEDGRSGILASTPEEWLSGLQRLVADDGLRASLAREARTDVIDRFLIGKGRGIVDGELTELLV